MTHSNENYCRKDNIYIYTHNCELPAIIRAYLFFYSHFDFAKLLILLNDRKYVEDKEHPILIPLILPDESLVQQYSLLPQSKAKGERAKGLESLIL